MKITSIEAAAAVLGVAPEASKAEIDSAYKQRARLLHPDRFEAGSAQQQVANESMQQLNEARDFILNYVPPKNPVPQQTSYTPAEEESYREMTPEEREEYRAYQRSQQILEEKEYRRLAIKELRKYGIIMSILIILELIGIYLLATQKTAVIYLAWVLIVFVFLAPIGKRFLDTWYTMLDITKTIRDIKWTDRQEAKEFKKTNKRKKKK